MVDIASHCKLMFGFQLTEKLPMTTARDNNFYDNGLQEDWREAFARARGLAVGPRTWFDTALWPPTDDGYAPPVYKLPERLSIDQPLSLEQIGQVALRDFGCQIYCAGGRRDTPEFFVCAHVPEVQHCGEQQALRRLPRLEVPNGTEDRLRRFCGVMGIAYCSPDWFQVEHWYEV